MLVGFWRLNFLIALLATLISVSAFAERITEYTVFDVRKSLPLSDDEKVYKDYYVNMGSEAGVRVGSTLSVFRKVPVIDIYRNKAQGDLVIPVARIKIIHVQKSMSVGRLEKVTSLKDIPVVDFEAVMMGDRVEIAAADGKGSAGLTDGDDDDDDDGTAVEGRSGGASAESMANKAQGATETQAPARSVQPGAAPASQPDQKEKKPVSGSATQNSVAPKGVATKLPPKKQSQEKKEASAKNVEKNIQINTSL